jgi:large subunit ribosomal protein L30
VSELTSPAVANERGLRQNQRDSLRSLGLKRINDVVVKEDRPEIRGMIFAVSHLVTVEEVE